jgi:hypothetical protein
MLRSSDNGPYARCHHGACRICHFIVACHAGVPYYISYPLRLVISLLAYVTARRVTSTLDCIGGYGNGARLFFNSETRETIWETPTGSVSGAEARAQLRACGVVAVVLCYVCAVRRQ